LERSGAQRLEVTGALQTGETWVAARQGRVYTRLWNGNRAKAAAPIVLLHDSLGCVELWRDFPARLAGATGRSVVAYDRVGFGRSDPSPELLAKTFVRDEAQSTFKSVIDALKIGRFIAFGHSVGGGMAVEIAARFPAACAALITESAQAFVESRTVEGIEQARRDFSRPGQLERLQKYHGDKARWVLDAWIDTWLSPAFSDWSLDAPLRQVMCPLLAIHGDQDEFGSVENPRRIVSGARGPAAQHVIPGCGHVPHREMPDAVLGIVSAWLEQVRPQEALGA
jgi:pimeloyl-ACP methyl ester carboxylesterase